MITSLNVQTANACGYTLSQKEYENIISLYNEKTLDISFIKYIYQGITDQKFNPKF